MAKRRVYKRNKIWPLVLLSILLMVLTVTVGGVYVSDQVISQYKGDCETFVGKVDAAAAYTSQALSAKMDALELYAADIGRTQTATDEELTALLDLYEQDGIFDHLYCITAQGGVLYSDPECPALQPVLYQSYIGKGTPSDMLYNSFNNSLLYVMPLPAGEGMPRLLLAQLELTAENVLYGQEALQNSIVYLLDESKRVVFGTGKPGEKFNYEQIRTQGLYTGSWEDIANYWMQYSDEDVLLTLEQQINGISDEHLQALLLPVIQGEKPEVQKSRIKELAGSVGDFIRLAATDDLLWFEGEVATAKADSWTLMVGTSAALAQETIHTAVTSFGILALICFVFFVLMLILIISQSRSNGKLSRLAYTDPISQAPNWLRFKQETPRLLRRHEPYAFIAIDIRNFKIINDVYGSDNGDKLLRTIGFTLGQSLQKRELHARLNGDEFALLLRYTTNEALEERLQRINAALLHASQIPSLHFSYGIFLPGRDINDADRMAACASIAKDIAKRNPDRFFAYFDESIRVKLLRERELEEAAPAAFQNHEFKVFLQPKYAPDGKTVAGAEALVRWVSDRMGFISPGDFIPLFEKNFTIIKLDLYMIDAVCALQRRWLDEGKTPVCVSVNLSRAHLLIPTVVEDIVSIVDSYALPHNLIELELTESAFFDDKTVLLNTIHALQNLGFKVLMDDFGSGYSSLNSLKDLPLDVIKLDGGFFNKSREDERGRIVVTDTISLAKHLNMKIVAEGIETREQVDFLADIGCDLIQGFYFAKPMPADEFATLISPAPAE